MSFAALFAAVLAAATFTVAATLPSADPDTYWHLANGRWMVEHGALMTADPFSFTRVGAPYSPGAWLGDLVWYGAFRIAEWQGIETLRAAVVAIATYFATRATLLVQPRPVFAIVPLLGALYVSRTLWIDGPPIFALVLFAVFLSVLLRARLEDRTGALAFLPPLALLWANLDGSAALGLAAIALFLLDAFVERRPERATLALVLAVSTGLSALNPASLVLFGAAANVASAPRLSALDLPPDVFTPQGAAFGALLVATLVGALLVRPRGTLWPILLAPVVLLGLTAERHLPIAALALAPYVALVSPDALARLVPRAKWTAPAPRGRTSALALPLAVLLGVSLVSAVRSAPVAPDERAFPRGALVALGATRGNLLNELDWGGYLEWKTQGRVYIAGRLVPYLPGLLSDVQEAVRLGPGFRDVLDRWAIDAVLLRPDRPLAVFLRDAGWRVAAEEAGRFVLLVRP